ncbi:DNA-directed RNA polymerase subunit K [Candidatus Pacearchaeota archaeon]|nr:MAG: DNA-directed RNA polymerase subunit K [Candidatus Pacearchaeota archaeon]
MASEEFSKYERARIIGARGLQISMDAPLLLEFSEEDLMEVNYDPLKIAEIELDKGVLPISVKKPLPLKKEEDIEKLKVEETKISDAEKERIELEEEKEIAESGEIIELANSEEEEVVEEENEEEAISEEVE